MKELKRVVISGMGALTPIGNSVPEFLQGLRAGHSGAGPITKFDSSAFKVRFACELKNFDPLSHFDRKEAAKTDSYARYALVSAAEAVRDAGLDFARTDRSRAGVIWASGIGGLETLQEQIADYVNGGRNPRFSPFMITKMIADMAAGLISIRYGLHGPNYATVSACASSTNALIDAALLIRLGMADVMVAGGSEASITEAAMGGFIAMKALSTRNADAATASRPFCSERDGFVLGEGAGALVLEELEHAQRRGAPIYAELSGCGMAADAYHVAASHPEGEGAFLGMRNALRDAGLAPAEVDYLNAHATSTPVGDLSETTAITRLFGAQPAQLSVSATKSMTGHLLGAAGAVEAIACILAIREGFIPPTINSTQRDAAIDPGLHLGFGTAMQKTVNVAMSNTFGFGGHNAIAVFRRFSG